MRRRRSHVRGAGRVVTAESTAKIESWHGRAFRSVDTLTTILARELTSRKFSKIGTYFLGSAAGGLLAHVAKYVEVSKELRKHWSDIREAAQFNSASAFANQRRS
jgi:hypothetical protein